MHDLVTQVTEPVTGMPQFQNSSKLTARGIEFEVEHLFSNGAQLRSSLGVRKRISGPAVAPRATQPAAVTAAQVMAEAADEQQHNAPLRNAHVNLVAPRFGIWTSAAELQYIGPRWTLSSGRLPSHVVANFNAVADFSAHTRLSIGIYNVFDRRYADPASIEHRQASLEQDGRSLRLQLSRDF